MKEIEITDDIIKNAFSKEAYEEYRKAEGKTPEEKLKNFIGKITSKDLNLKTKEKIVKEKSISKIVEEILEDQDIKVFGNASHIIMPKDLKGKKAIIGVYEK